MRCHRKTGDPTACILLMMTCRNLRAWRRVLAVLGGQPSADDRGGYYSGELAWSFLGARYDPICLSGSFCSRRPRMGRPRVDAVCLVSAAAFPRAGPCPVPLHLRPSLPVLVLADYPRRNEAFVFREPGRRENKSKKNLDNA